MILSILDNNSLILDTYGHKLKGIKSRVGQFNQIARMIGFNDWGEVKKAMGMSEIQLLDRLIHKEISTSTQFSMFTFDPLLIEQPIQKLVDNEVKESDLLDFMRIINFFSVLAFSGLHKTSQSVTGKYLCFKTTPATCSLANLDTSGMTLEQLIANTHYLFKEGQSLIKLFDGEYQGKPNDSLLLSHVLNMVNYVCRDASTTTFLAREYALIYHMDAKKFEEVIRFQSMHDCGHRALSKQNNVGYQEVITLEDDEAKLRFSALRNGNIWAKSTGVDNEFFEAWAQENGDMYENTNPAMDYASLPEFINWFQHSGTKQTQRESDLETAV